MHGLRSRLRSKMHSPSESSNGNHLSQYASDDPYLSYYDIRLTRDDIETLHSGWLTDNTLAFWEEFLEREFLSAFPTSHIILLRPSMVMMLKLATDTGGPRAVMGMRSALPDVRRATHIFLPVNDCTDPEKAEGGSHWSLAVMSVRDRISFHYDSMRGSNASHARKVVVAMQQLIDGSSSSSRTASAQSSISSPRSHSHASAQTDPSSHGAVPPQDGTRSPTGPPPVRQEPWRYLELPDSPQQSNGSDCGVYVAMIMQHLLLKRVLGARKHETVSMSLTEKSVNAEAGRKDMLDTIERFREMGEKWQDREDAAVMVDGEEAERSESRQHGLAGLVHGGESGREGRHGSGASRGSPAAGHMHKRPSSPPRVDSMVKRDLADA